MNFGDAGPLSDLNVPDKSTAVGALLNGNLEISTEECEINGNVRDWMHFLVDGIHPPWSIFVNTFSNKEDPIKKEFADAQEAVRKDVFV